MKTTVANLLSTTHKERGGSPTADRPSCRIESINVVILSSFRSKSRHLTGTYVFPGNGWSKHVSQKAVGQLSQYELNQVREDRLHTLCTSVLWLVYTGLKGFWLNGLVYLLGICIQV